MILQEICLCPVLVGTTYTSFTSLWDDRLMKWIFPLRHRALCSCRIILTFFWCSSVFHPHTFSCPASNFQTNKRWLSKTSSHRKPLRRCCGRSCVFSATPQYISHRLTKNRLRWTRWKVIYKNMILRVKRAETSCPCDISKVLISLDTHQQPGKNKACYVVRTGCHIRKSVFDWQSVKLFVQTWLTGRSIKLTEGPGESGRAEAALYSKGLYLSTLLGFYYQVSR